MTDSEIIKALECCTKWSCDECPIDHTHGCLSGLQTNALDLIKRQQAEIRKLEKTVSHLEDYCNSIPDKARAEAIKEFEDKLKEKAVDVGICDAQGNSFGGATVVFVGDIDNLVKEMGCGKQ